MRVGPQFLVYLAGVVLFGFFYGPVKLLLGGSWLFIGAVVVYLIALRLVGALVARHTKGARSEQDA